MPKTTVYIKIIFFIFIYYNIDYYFCCHFRINLNYFRLKKSHYLSGRH